MTSQGQRKGMGAPTNVVGEVLQGTYKVERMLGEGGMGAVYEASHQRLARRFAVKLLYPQVAAHPEALARFQREAYTTSAIGHPHILEVIDFNHLPDGAPYIIMELLDGEDLAERLERDGPMTLPALASVFKQAASALAAAHGQGIIHRDLKPPNIFLCNRGERDDFVKIVDFGISKVLGGQSVVTRTQTLMGTPSYMSPEQAEERAADVDLRTDIYAMATILYECLAGRPPHAGQSIPTLLYKIVHEEPPLLRTLRQDIPPAIEDAIHQALAKDREDRYGSMTEFWDCFAAALGDDNDFTEPTEDHQGLNVASRQLPRLDITGPPQDLRGSLGGPQRAQAPTIDVGQVTTMSAGSGETMPSAPTAPKSNRGVLVFAAVAVLIAAGATLAGLNLSGQPEAPAAKEPVEAPAAAATGPADAAGATPVDAAVATVDAAVPEKRRLWVTSNPPGARVLLGGRRIGKTPLEGIAIRKDAHALALQKRGYRTVRIAIDAAAQKVRLATVELERRKRRTSPIKHAAKSDAPAAKPAPKKSAPEKPSPKKRRKGWIMTPVIK